MLADSGSMRSQCAPGSQVRVYKRHVNKLLSVAHVIHRCRPENKGQSALRVSMRPTALA